MQLTVNISDLKVSKNPDDVLVTYSLGSCIGVAVADPYAKVAGLLHFQLPEAQMDTERAERQPAMFGDTGLDALIAAVQDLGAEKRRLRVKLAGGAKMLAGSDTFDIGRRNHAAIRKALWKHGLLVDSEDCGGSVPRTMYVNVADGRVMLKRRTEEVRRPTGTPNLALVHGPTVTNVVADAVADAGVGSPTSPTPSPMRIGY